LITIPCVRTLARIAYPGGENGRFNILIYHRVLEEPDPLAPAIPDINRFRWQMDLLRRYFSVLPLSKAVDHLYAGTLPSRTMCITFDDGYRDNLEVAAPILKEMGLPATIFIAAGFLNDGMMWNDRIIESIRSTSLDQIDLAELGFCRYILESDIQKIQAIHNLLSKLKYLPIDERDNKTDLVCERLGGIPKKSLMLHREDLPRLSEYGFEIGGHTVSHPILVRMEDKQAANEIQNGKTELEKLVNKPVNLFAYPNGLPNIDYSEIHVQQVSEAGFKAAVSTHPSVAMKSDDRFQLPRFTPWDHAPIRYLARLILHGLKPANGARSHSPS